MKILALALLAGLLLTGCGRKGAPSPPGPASAVTYPQTYPTQ
jgi:predicted small lipoprotein YifL